MTTQKPDVEEIFLASVQKDPADRQAFLEETCADSNVRTRVEALLIAHDSAGSFLASPAVQTAPLAGTHDSLEHGSAATAVRETLDFLDRCDTPGQLGLLAHYEILEILGSGGMGVVLRGLDVKLNRVVAIKVLAPQLAANATARRRFLREAQAAAAVSHEHVVAIYAVDEFKGLPYLVMECIAGSSLQQKIDGGALELAQILRIGTQIASGLAAAHAQGLVHRDIKPANILLENGVERVKITDFGLARSVDDVRITQAGKVYGTPLYMSPEQAHGERVDQRSDLFSLGSVLYAMSTGRPPFRGETGLAVLKRVCDDTPRPIQEVNPEIPSALVEIVNKLLAKSTDARFQSAGEVADLLGQCLSELQQHGRVDSPASILSPLPKPTNAAPEPAQGHRPKSEKRPFPGLRWFMAIAASLVLLAGFGLTEAAGVTDVRGTVIRLFLPDATLVVEIDDPGVSVRIDGEEIVITGAGAKEIRLKPGQYKLQASKDGKLVRQELVTVTKNRRQVVRVSKEGQSVAIGDEPPGTPALQEKKSAPYKNSIGMEFVLVPKGKAWLGGGEGRPGEKEVEIKEDFYLGKFEVTQEEWEQVMGANPSHFSHAGAGKAEVKDVPAAEGQRFPVEMVSWEEAQVFLRLLNQRDRQKGWEYRLPTEVEWEYACRGGPMADRMDSAFDYYFDRPVAVLQPHQANYNHPELNRSCKVGSYPPNKLGLCDMHGNVWEWCDDEEKLAVGEMNRVYRGGCWESHYECRATARLVHTSSMRNKHLGLRLARVPAAAAPVDKATVAAATPGPAAVSRRAKHPAGATDRPVKVFVLAGDSNMAGRAKVALLNYQANQAETKERFQHLLEGGEWVVRDDVWIKNFHQKGSLTVGFGQEPSMFGPELEFGNVVGDHFAEQVLVIKTCWGGSLFANFRSPSSGPPDQTILDLCRMELQVAKPNPTPAEVEQHCGAMYREMLTEIRQTVANLGEHFPNYQGQGYEIAGFVWFQGWNDVVNPQVKSNYSELLAHFIRDVRSDLKAPHLPFAIGQFGFLGSGAPDSKESSFRAAQAAVAQLPEFAGNVQLVKTESFWDHEAEAVFKKGWENHRDEWNKVGSDRPYHYLGSAKTFCGIGKAFGEGMIELCSSGAKN